MSGEITTVDQLRKVAEHAVLVDSQGIAYQAERHGRGIYLWQVGNEVRAARMW